VLLRETRVLLQGTKGLAARDEGLALIVKTAVGEPLGLGYGTLRRQEIASREGQMPNVFKVVQGSGSVSEPERPERVSAQPTLTTWIHLEDAPSITPSHISSPMIPLTVLSLVALPATAEAEGFLIEFGAQVKMQGGLIHDHMVRLGELSPGLFERYDRDIRELFTRSMAVRDEIFSKRYQLRSLDNKKERVVVTGGAIRRPVLALESWAGQTDTQRAALWHTISDTHIKNQELRL
nr:hypothetical protein [Tanacetum cinerariifolium]